MITHTNNDNVQRTPTTTLNNKIDNLISTIR